jgi:hypothetical protein
MARHGDERRPGGIGDRERVAVGLAGADRGLGAPERVVVRVITAMKPSMIAMLSKANARAL